MTVEEILNQYRVQFKEAGTDHHVSHGWIGLECPWCGKGSGVHHLGINLAGKFASCWKCGSHRLLDVLVELTGERLGVCYKLLGGVDPDRTIKDRPAGHLKFPPGITPMLKVHRDYLSGRGFDPDELERLWGLKGIGLVSRLAWRIFIPVVRQSETVSWTTRATSDDAERRYVAASAAEERIPAKSLLYGADFVRHAAVVCEGPADVWRIGPGAVATLGTGFSRAQLVGLGKFPTRVVCFDSDSDAQRRARKLCKALEVFDGKTINVELDAADPGSASKKEIKELRRRFLE